MSKRSNWMLRIVLLLVLLATMILVCICANRKEITGTFSTGNGISGDDLYIAFFPGPRNEFLIYRQDADILNGTYSMEELGGNVIAKMVSSEGQIYLAIYDRRNSLRFVKTDPLDISDLAKISDTPMIIGHRPGDSWEDMGV